MRHPRISILLPFRDAAETLPTCLASIRRQTEQRFECVLVDDGSRDDGLDRARRETMGDDRFRFLVRPREGLVPALRAGAEACRAPVVARMDADDWMHRDRLARQLDALRRAPELQAVGTHIRSFPRAGLADGRRAYERWLNEVSSPAAIHRSRYIECPVAHPTLAIRSEALRSHPYRDCGWPEDYDLILRLLRSGPCVGVIPERLLGWRDHPERLSRTHPTYGLSRFTACRAWHLSRDFLADVPGYVLWGHGPTGRALRRALDALGHHPVSIVDVHPRRIGKRLHGAEVVAPDALADMPPHPIVVSVAGAKPRGEIRAALRDMGRTEGVDFVFAA